MEGLQEGSETSDVIWFGDSVTEQKTRGRVKEVEILFGSDEDGQDEERAHQRDRAGQKALRQS